MTFNKCIVFLIHLKAKIILYDSTCYTHWEHKYDLHWTTYTFSILILNAHI